MKQIVEDLIRKKLNLDRESLNIIPAGTGKFSTTYFVERPDGPDDLVIRIAPPDDLLLLFYEKRMMRQEPALHRLIQKRTDIPVPTILVHDFSRTLIDRDYVIMNKMPGQPLSEMQHRLSEPQMNRALRELGQMVAELHSITIQRYGYVGAHKPMEPQGNWHDAFEIMWENMLRDCHACGVYTTEDVDLGMKLWNLHQDVFDNNCPAVLCHMDLWAQNLLVNDEGRVTCLFDFDRACFGDVENEFAVAKYCGLTTKAFWDGYGVRTAMTQPCAVRRLFYFLYEHQKYIVISISARRNNPPLANRYREECITLMNQFIKSGIPALSNL